MKASERLAEDINWMREDGVESTRLTFDECVDLLAEIDDLKKRLERIESVLAGLEE